MFPEGPFGLFRAPGLPLGALRMAAGAQCPTDEAVNPMGSERRWTSCCDEQERDPLFAGCQRGEGITDWQVTPA